MNSNSEKMCLSVNEITNTNYESISKLNVGARLSQDTLFKKAIKIICKPVHYDQIYVSDFLALATQHTRKTFQLIKLCHKRLQASVPCK